MSLHERHSWAGSSDACERDTCLISPAPHVPRILTPHTLGKKTLMPFYSPVALLTESPVRPQKNLRYNNSKYPSPRNVLQELRMIQVSSVTGQTTPVMSSSNPAPNVLTQIPLDEDARPGYSDAELRDYFECIKLPQKYLNSIVLKDRTQAGTKEHGLPLLRALTRHHTCNVPFDNLVLHYSTHKIVTLDLAELYTKIVRRRLGGRCMENNSFFGTVLRSLGYEVRNCGGRVARAMSPYPDVRRNQSMTYDGWNHMLNLVRLDDEWYVVDVGMGSMGPNLPFPLRDGFETTSVPPRLIRLQLRSIPESYATKSANGTGSPKMWCFDICYNPVDDATKEWLPVYCFTETEFLPQDYEVMSWFTSTNPRSFFTRYVTCTKMLMDEDKEMIVGNVTLFKDTVRKTIGTNRMVIKECKTEDERLQALAEIFNVHLTDEEKRGIPHDRILA